MKRFIFFIALFFSVQLIFSQQNTTVDCSAGPDDISISCTENGFLPITFTAACATCINPQVNFEMVSDCLNGPQFFVDANVLDLGSASSLTISDNQGKFN